MSWIKYKELISLLGKKHRVYVFNFPGFGKAEKPDKPWNLDDYADFTTKYIREKKLKRVIVIGHSFGGRVAIRLASKKNRYVKKLILIGSAGIERKNIWTKILNLISRIVPEKIKGVTNGIFRSKDGRDFLKDKIIKKTFENIVGENQEIELKNIEVPVLIVWGDRDQTTPLWMAELIKKGIKNSEMVVIEGGDHGLPYRKPEVVAREIVKYLH